MSSPVDPRIETYPVVPSGFDLVGAAKDRLDYYGIPERPDPASSPEMFDFWKTLVSAPFTARQPTFRSTLPQMQLRSQFRRQSRDVGQGPCGCGMHESSLNWSGALVSPPFPKRLVTVVGGWTVPRVSAPSSQPLFTGSNAARSLVWIGLDGYNGRLPKISLPQIGTAQCMDSPEYFAWWDWWRNWPPGTTPPESIERIENFDISPGDEILAGMTVLITEDVLFFIKNQSSGEFRSFLARRHPLLDIEPLGSSAEWIVERPTEPTNRKFHPLPNYGTVEFKYCYALAADHANGTSRLVTLAQNNAIIRMREAFAAPYRTHYVSRAKLRRDPDGSVGVTCTFNDSV